MDCQLLNDLFSWNSFYLAYIYLRDYFVAGRHARNETLEGKTVIITGGSAGIGKETALDLSRRGARVIITCRDLQKGEDVVKYIHSKVLNADITVKSLDLASFASIRRFSQEILENEKHIDILINNAGICAPPARTGDGFEAHFAVNHLGHFLLTNLLLERIKASGPARIITVTSALHIFGRIDFNDLKTGKQTDTFEAYCCSKLCNVLFTRELARILEDTAVSTYCVHPGIIRTEIMRDIDVTKSCGCRFYSKFFNTFFRSPEKGARTSVYCAVEESIKNDSGMYYCDCTPVLPSKLARDDELAKELWCFSKMLVEFA